MFGDIFTDLPPPSLNCHILFESPQTTEKTEKTERQKVRYTVKRSRTGKADQTRNNTSYTMSKTDKKS